MRITDHDIIKNGEQELIDTITADLDWGVIEKIFMEEHKLRIEEKVEYKKGDMIVYDNQIAYKLEFDVNVILTVLLDRDGNYISVSSSGDQSKLEDKDDDDMPDDEEKAEKETEDSYKAALSEIDWSTPPENDDVTSPASNVENPQEKISKRAAQAGEMIPDPDIS